MARQIWRPTSVEPVKATLSTSGCTARAAPVAPAPTTAEVSQATATSMDGYDARKTKAKQVEVFLNLLEKVLFLARSGPLMQLYLH